MNDILNDAWSWLVQRLLNWALSTFDTFLTWWIAGSGSAYNVQLTGKKGPGGVLYDLRLYTNWATAALVFAALSVAAFRIAVQRRGEPFREVLSQLFQLTILIFTLATIVNLLNIAGDQYSQLIIEHMKPKGDEWKEYWHNGLDLIGGEDDVSFILAFFALAAALSSVMQFVLMLFRNGALIVLVGILPVVAASRFTSYGEAAYRRCLGLLISFIIVKPVIATIDAAALKLMASTYDSDHLFGLALVAGSVFAMPATLRAVMPAATEGYSSFGIRQVGHFMYGGTAVTMRNRIYDGLGALLPGGGNAAGGGPVDRAPAPPPPPPPRFDPGGTGGGGSQGGSGGSPTDAGGGNRSGGSGASSNSGGNSAPSVSSPGASWVPVIPRFEVPPAPPIPDYNVPPPDLSGIDG